MRGSARGCATIHERAQRAHAELARIKAGSRTCCTGAYANRIVVMT